MPTKLGQNFLKDEDIVKKIIASSNLTKDDFVIEIGPGKGVLTEELAKKAGKIVAIELDKNLFEKLGKKFEKQDNLVIINQDILKLNIPKLIQNSKLKVKNSYKVIANIPYYITSAIIRLFLETEIPPQEMILMIQKEVAERIVAKPGEMSILAVSVQYYAKAEILFHVPKEAFDPIPEVDSAIIKIITHPDSLPERDGDFAKKFFRIVKAGFSAKRKTLLNNLSNSLHLPKPEAEEKLKAAGIFPTARAQELSIEDWKKLADCLT